MEESRILPILRIHDTDFHVDLEKLEFRQVDNDKNTISFYDVHDSGDHTEVMYDPKTKNAFKGSWGEMSQREDLVLVKMPPAIELDTQYIADQLVKNLREKYFGIRQTDDEDKVRGDVNQKTDQVSQNPTPEAFSRNDAKSPNEQKRKAGRGI
ncbi:MAG: hypothetical protein HOP08_18875 [Cyclobacteriaceae bacterium]|nr:hypothetical protein [Cyclobacteriaceae bacterium]